MAQAIKTVLTYNLDGATKDFNIPFEYLARKFVVVTLIGVDRKVLVLNQDYRFATRTTISTTLAWGTAQGYQQIEIRRYTSATERLVDFTDGSILRAYDLNVAQVQTLHVAEEARDLTADTIGVNNDGNLDARGRRIVNLALAVEDTDAITFGQVKTMNQNAWDARNQAEQFKNEAGVYANNALNYQNSASIAQVDSYNRSQQALQYRNEAEQFKNQAAASQGASAGSAQAAANSQADASRLANEALVYSNSAKADADRAKIEADKLSNWNALAGTIDGITDKYVEWNRNAVFRGDGPEVRLLRSSDATSAYMGGYTASGGLDWYLGKGDVGEEIQLSRTNAGFLKMASGFTQLAHGATNILMSGGGLDYTSGGHTFRGIVRLDGPQSGGSNTVYVSGKEQNDLHLVTDTGASGTGVNGIRGTWYNCTWGMYGVRGNSTDLPYVTLNVVNAGVDAGSFGFSHDGTFSVDRGFTLVRNGNISGPAWDGGWLHTHIENRYNSRVSECRSGPLQYYNPGENGWWNGWQLGNGFIVGMKNHTDDGNSKFTEVWFRVPQWYSAATGWREFTAN